MTLKYQSPNKLISSLPFLFAARLRAQPTGATDLAALTTTKPAADQ